MNRSRIKRITTSILCAAAVVAIVLLARMSCRWYAEHRLIAYPGSIADQREVGGWLRMLSATSSEDRLYERTNTVCHAGPVWDVALGLKGQAGLRRLRHIVDCSNGARRMHALVGIAWSDHELLRPYLARHDAPSLWNDAFGAAYILRADEFVPMIEQSLSDHPEFRDPLVDTWLTRLKRSKSGQQNGRQQNGTGTD